MRSTHHRHMDHDKERGDAAPPVRVRHFARSLPMALLRAREAAMRHFRPALRRFDITEQQWRVLHALMTAGEMEVTELAHATFLLGPSLSRILRDLENRLLIQRRVDDSDQRRAIVSLTLAGETLIEAVTPGSEAIYAEMTRRFGADKLLELQNMLRDFEQALAAGAPIAEDFHLAEEKHK